MPASRQTLLVLCLAGSVLLHAGTGLLLADLTTLRAAPGGLSARQTARTATVSVRFEPLPPPATVLPDLDRLPPTAAGPRPASLPAKTPTPARPMPPADTASVAVPVAVSTGDTLSPAEPLYLPRDALSRSPAPRQPIDLPYPERAPSGRFRAVLTLFIDDLGVVQRVRFDDTDEGTGLPPLLEDSARQTFLHSLFAPGEVEGRPVRSQLRIEVEFATEDPTQTSASTRR